MYVPTSGVATEGVGVEDRVRERARGLDREVYGVSVLVDLRVSVDFKSYRVRLKDVRGWTNQQIRSLDRQQRGGNIDLCLRTWKIENLKQW